MACRTCSGLNATGQGEGVFMLTSITGDSRTQLRECPSCKDLFVWEDHSSWTGSGNDDSESLTRLSQKERELVRALQAKTLDDLAPVLALGEPLRGLAMYFASSDLRRGLIPSACAELARKGVDPQLLTLIESYITDAESARYVMSLLESTPPGLARSSWERLTERCARRGVVPAAKPKPAPATAAKKRVWSWFDRVDHTATLDTASGMILWARGTEPPVAQSIDSFVAGHEPPIYPAPPRPILEALAAAIAKQMS